MSIPLTGKPKTVASKKFQPMCAPIGTQSCFVTSAAKANQSPAATSPTMAVHEMFGLLRCSSENPSDESSAASGTFSPSIRLRSQ